MRRPIVIAPVLAVLVVLVGLGLRSAAVGDDDRASAVAERYGLAVAGKDVRALCGRLLSARVTGRLEAAGYPCEPTLARALADVRAPTLRVLASEVDGGTARVRVDTGAAGQERTEATLVMREEGGDWRISSLGDALSASAGRPSTQARAAARRPGAPPAPPLTPGVVPLVTVPRGSELQDGIVPSSRLPGVPSGPARPTGRRGDRNATTTTDEPTPSQLRRAREEQGERDEGTRGGS